MEHHRNLKESRANRKLKDISKYEIIETRIVDKKTYQMYLDFDNYKGWFSYQDILDFKECNMSYSQLHKRINNIHEKMGLFYTAKDAIISPCNSNNGHPKGYDKLLHPKSFEYREELKKKMLEENDLFKDCMRLMPVGSLHKNSKIIQGKSYERTV